MTNRFIPALVAALMVAGTAAAQTGRDPIKADNARFGDPTSIARVYQDYLYGVIKEIKKDEIVLEKTKFGVDQTLALNSKTKYIHDGKPASQDGLKVGDKVWVDVKTKKKTGALIAKKVVSGLMPTGNP